MKQQDEARKLKKYEETLENAYHSKQWRQRKVLKSLKKKEQASLSAQRAEAQRRLLEQAEFEQRRLQYEERATRPTVESRVRSQELRNKIFERELKIVHKQLEEEKLTRKAILLRLNAERRKQEL